MPRLIWDGSVTVSGHSLVLRIPAELARMGGLGRGSRCRVILVAEGGGEDGVQTAETEE